MILVDTSVWVDHLRSNDSALVKALETGIVFTHPFVVGDYSSLDATVATAARLLGGLDVMVQSGAGRTEASPAWRPFEKIDPTEILGYALTHWVSKAYCIKATLPYMQSSGGRMVIITSDAGRYPTQGEALIGGGAAACIQMVRTLSKEFSRWKININGIAISLTDTGDRIAGAPSQASEFQARMSSKLASRQVMHVEGKHVAAAALFFGSDAAEATTGQTISVNGGISV